MSTTQVLAILDLWIEEALLAKDYTRFDSMYTIKLYLQQAQALAN